jgi:hypothetical protein
MKRVKLKEPMVFDITERMRVLHGMEDFVFRVRVDENGIKIWKRATQGNLDAPRPLDKFIQLSWEQVGKSGDAYHGSRDRAASCTAEDEEENHPPLQDVREDPCPPS